MRETARPIHSRHGQSLWDGFLVYKEVKDGRAAINELLEGKDWGIQ